MNPAFRIALNETLGRPATPEEWFAYSTVLQRMLGGTRVYVATEKTATSEVYEKIVQLRSEGLSIRKIARKVGVSKSNVHDALSGILSYQVDTHAA
jgi:DNA-binding NarL/FixJ family response regulator